MNIMNPVPKSCRSELFDDRCRSHTACSIDFSYRTEYRYKYGSTVLVPVYVHVPVRTVQYPVPVRTELQYMNMVPFRNWRAEVVPKSINFPGSY